METMHRYKLTVLFFCLFLFSSFKTEVPERVVTIFMIGDSTMANKNLDGGNPERGWGQMLPAFFTGPVRIDNHAQNGRSSKSFIEEGRWQQVTDRLQPGDYVFIQFGHNDSKTDAARYTHPRQSYKENLERFIRETHAKGAIPVLFTSIVRRHFDENGRLIDTHGEYVVVTREVARETGVILIDLNKSTHELIEELGPERSKELFVWVEPGQLACFPTGKQDDTHLNINGARQVAKLALKELKEQLPGLASRIQWPDFVVAQDGSGDFFTVQEAINAVPDYRKNSMTTILIRSGLYKEKVVIPESKINVWLAGEEGTVLAYDDYAAKPNLFGEQKTTSGSASIYIYSPNFHAENLTFANTSGPVGQAVAVLVKGDRAIFRKCRFLGFQDTLYTYGTGRQYYEECYIEGTVDFIFGGATAVFNRCTIHSLGKGYITAPSTPEGTPYGYVFLDCKLTAAEGVDRVYLSRPWRPFAKAVFIRCDMDGHILPAGWHNWNKPEAEATLFYREYQSRGKGANPQARATFAGQLPNIDTYTISGILAGTDEWDPLQPQAFPIREN
ncbi:MAG: pectinesterase family protein [Tannerellaceae bacterium]|nr:pectinesterase family protein [Tannerellaceae bacterium]